MHRLRCRGFMRRWQNESSKIAAADIAAIVHVSRYPCTCLCFLHTIVPFRFSVVFLPATCTLRQPRTWRTRSVHLRKHHPPPLQQHQLVPSDPATVRDLLRSASCESNGRFCLHVVLTCDRPDYSEVITVLVGQEEKSFTVHKAIICAKSQFFATACSQQWQEGRSGVVRLSSQFFVNLYAISPLALHSVDRRDHCWDPHAEGTAVLRLPSTLGYGTFSAGL